MKVYSNKEIPHCGNCGGVCSPPSVDELFMMVMADLVVK